MATQRMNEVTLKMFKEIITSPLNKTIVLRLELRGRTNLLTKNINSNEHTQHCKRKKSSNSCCKAY